MFIGTYTCVLHWLCIAQLPSVLQVQHNKWTVMAHIYSQTAGICNNTSGVLKSTHCVSGSISCLSFKFHIDEKSTSLNIFLPPETSVRSLIMQIKRFLKHNKLASVRQTEVLRRTTVFPDCQMVWFLFLSLCTSTSESPFQKAYKDWRSLVFGVWE